MTLSEELRWRGFINQTTIENLSTLDENKLRFYHGYDASSDSLTIGNLAAVMMDKVFVRHGWQPVILAGGATSLVGDPGGKDSERPLQSVEQIEANVAAVSAQIRTLFGSETTFANNLDWFKDMSVLEFLRDTGKHFSMTPLVQRDYIAKRIGEGGRGISYTEFSYTLLQGYDYLHLYREYGVKLQVAGSDQWGNSISGVDLVRRVEGEEVNVLTCPLIINKTTGKKFGKSEDGAVWLNPTKTSVYSFYQFWLNVDDEGVEDYLKVFTELDKSAIDGVMREFQANKSGRAAQKTLAREVTKLVHGQQATDSIQRVTDVLFKGENYDSLRSADFVALKQELPLVNAEVGQPILKSFVEAGFITSNSEARRFLEQGGLYINGKTLESDRNWEVGDALDGGHVIVRRGKNNNAVIQLST